MFRSAIVAVLAVALSSSVAAAQAADQPLEIDIVSQIGFDLTPPIASAEVDIDVLAMAGFDTAAPEAIEIATVTGTLSLTELAQPVLPDNAEDSMGPETAFLRKTEMLFSRNLDRAQDFFKRTRINAGNMLMAARTQPRFGLYAAQGTLQALDILTTHRALNAGHTEANPLFKNGNRAGMVLAKSASFGLHVYLTERLAERRPKTAKWLMVATNAFMSLVVVNNVAVGGSQSQ